MRVLASLLALGGLPGCAFLAGQGAVPTTDCPVITEASAWTNRMPSTGARAPVTRVSVTFDAPSTLRHYRDEAAPADHQSLELRPSDQPALPAIGYREPVKEPPREWVSISCSGKQLVRMDSIMDVY